MGTSQYIVELRTLNIKSNTLRMKAFVAAVATLAASANSQVLVNPYFGGLVHPGLGYAGVPVATVEAPATIAAAPAAAIAPLPVAPLTQQFHSQDEFGNTGYGYTNINSAKHEVGHPLVGVSGGYTFVDANNELQTVSYIADGRGFQVKATNLPVAPTFNPELPVAPVDTAEVAAAKADHAAAHVEINAREKRSTPASTDLWNLWPICWCRCSICWRLCWWLCIKWCFCSTLPWRPSCTIGLQGSIACPSCCSPQGCCCCCSRSCRGHSDQDQADPWPCHCLQG